MTADPGSEEAYTATVGSIKQRLNDYLDTLDAERDLVENMLDDLEDAPEGESLTREEYRNVFPATSPMEEWGNTDG